MNGMMVGIRKAASSGQRMARQAMMFLAAALLGLSTVLSSVDAYAANSDSHDLSLLLGGTIGLDVGETMTVLPGGGKLFIGGARNSKGLRFQRGSWAAVTTLAATLGESRKFHSSTLLPDGRVLVYGGLGMGDRVLDSAEIYDPISETVSMLGSVGLLPRANHSATVLPGGRIVFIGGKGADGKPLQDAEYLDSKTLRAESKYFHIETSRLDPKTALLPDDSVLAWGGFDAQGRQRRDGTVISPKGASARTVSAQEAATAASALWRKSAPKVSGSMPKPRATDVDPGITISVQFDKAMLQSSLTGETVTLIGPGGAVDIKPISLERGLLLFVKPKRDLLPATNYTLFISGAKAESGEALEFSAIGFRTSALGQDSPANSGADTSLQLPDNSAASFAGGVRATTLPVAIPANSLRTLYTSLRMVLDGYGLELVAQSNVDVPFDDSDVWHPTARNRQGDWVMGQFESSKRSRPKTAELERALHGDPDVLQEIEQWTTRKMPQGFLRNLRAKVAAKVRTRTTAVAGQVLRLNGRPLANVTISIKGHSVRTDSNGEFQLTGVSSGRQVLVIEGSSANNRREQFGRHEYGVEVVKNRLNVLPFVIWMSRIDTDNAIQIESPTRTMTVLTNSRIPGLELRIPAGTVIRDANGKIVTSISMTAIPIDQPPFPVPDFPVPVYFSVQPGGAHLERADGSPSSGAQLVYPNYTNGAPGARMTFWDYDSAQKGWYAYGEGSVSADGKQVVPDPGVVVYQFTGAMTSDPSIAPGVGPSPGAGGPSGGPGGGPGGPPGPGNPDGGERRGDPVDLASGLMVEDRIDIFIPDTVPIAVRRSYRQLDAASRAFGIGTNLWYDMFLVGDASPWTYQILILPDGGRVRFARISPGTSFADAVFQNLDTPGQYFGAILKWKGSTDEYWTLTLRDGTVFGFAESKGSTIARKGAMRLMRDRFGNVVTVTRDTNFNVTRLTSPNGRQINLTYNAQKRITSATDDIGRSVTYTYDALGRLTGVTDSVGTASYTYDGYSNLLTHTDRRGNQLIANTYDSNNRVSAQTFADGSTMLFNYVIDSTSSKIVRTDITDQRGVEERVYFNDGGYPVKITKAFGLPIEQSATAIRNEANLPTHSVDSLGRTTVFAYDSNGDLTSIQRPNGGVTRYEYEPIFNQLKRVVDANGNASEVIFNEAGHVAATVDAMGRNTAVQRDGAGRMLQITDQNGNPLSFSHFGGNLTAKTDALGRSTFYMYDAIGRMLQAVDPLKNVTTFSYDAKDRVTSVVDGNGNSVSRSYDANGNLLAEVDARGGVVSYTYNSMNRVTSRTNALNEVESYIYEPGGKISRLIDRKGQVTGFTYDALGRLIQVGYGGTLSNPTSFSETVTYTWDAGNRATQINDSIGGVITRTYDSADNVTNEVTPQGTVGYTYDLAGRRTGMAVSGQSAISYSYDTTNLIVSITQSAGPDNGNITKAISVSYDAAGRRSLLVSPSGLRQSFSYDAANQLIGVEYRNSSNGVIGDLAYGYDAAGRRNSIGGSLAASTLPSAVADATYNANNQIQSWDGTNFTYDANGALIHDGAESYSWDSRQRLVSVSGGFTAAYQYDVFGRRVEKQVNGVATGFMYDGQNFVQEKASASPGAAIRANLMTLGIDGIIDRRSDGVDYGFIRDALGTVLGEVSRNAVSADALYEYDPYGNSATESPSNNSQRFTGRERDAAGLYYYRARYYQPRTGRFLSEDPLGWQSGQFNNYAYVGGNPVNFSDPTGLICFSPDMASMYAYGAAGLLGGLALGKGDPRTATTLMLLGLVAGGAAGQYEGMEGDAVGTVINAVGSGGGSPATTTLNLALGAFEVVTGTQFHDAMANLPGTEYLAGGNAGLLLGLLGSNGNPTAGLAGLLAGMAGAMKDDLTCKC